VEQVKLHDLKREQRRLEQVAVSERKRSNRKRKREDMEKEDGPDPDLGTGDQKRKRESEPPPTSTATAATDHTQELPTLESPSLQSSRKAARLAALATATPMSKPLPEVRGHTSYLTFATLLPVMPPKDDMAPQHNRPTDTSWDTTTADFDQLIASIPEEVSVETILLFNILIIYYRS
jgi:tRNA (adenine57-N1/adenine58-N1)-methyltransferase